MELFLLLAGLRPGQSGRPSHEVGRELSNGRARPPAEGLHSDLAEDGPDGDLDGGGSGGDGVRCVCDVGSVRADDLCRVGRAGEFQAAALVSRHRDGGDVRAQVEEEGVKASAQTHRAEDAQPHPPSTPGEIVLPAVERLLVGARSVVQGQHQGAEEESHQEAALVLGQGQCPVPQGQHQLTATVLQHKQWTPVESL